MPVDYQKVLRKFQCFIDAKQGGNFMADRTIRDALKRAQKDPAFAVDLVSNPKKHAKEFNLTRAEISGLSKGKRFMMDSLKAGARLSAAAAPASAGGPY